MLNLYFIYRKAYDVYASNQYLRKITYQDYSLQRLNKTQISELIIRSYKLLTQRYLDTRNLIPDGHLFELRYEELAADPVGMLEAVYNSFHLPNFENARPAFHQYITRRCNYHPKKYRLSKQKKRLVDQNWGNLLARLSSSYQ